jgi:hypothetical protein
LRHKVKPFFPRLGRPHAPQNIVKKGPRLTRATKARNSSRALDASYHSARRRCPFVECLLQLSPSPFCHASKLPKHRIETSLSGNVEREREREGERLGRQNQKKKKKKARGRCGAAARCSSSPGRALGADAPQRQPRRRRAPHLHRLLAAELGHQLTQRYTIVTHPSIPYVSFRGNNCSWADPRVFFSLVGT